MENDFRWKDIKLPKWNIPSFLVGFLIGLTICWYIIDSYSACMPQGECLYQLGNANVTGNCKEIIPLVKQTVEINLSKISKYNLATHGEIRYEQEESITSTSNTIPTTTIACPTCQICETCPVFSSKTLLNMMPGPNGNPAISAGFAECKRKTLDTLKLKKSKYTEAESPSKYYNNLIQADNISQNTFNFIKDGKGFWLNRTPDQQGKIMWSWDDAQCLGSSMWVYQP
jgi:hypothetical protein